MEAVGKNIAALRKRHDWTQARLADRAGVSQTTIANIENYANPDLKPTHAPNLSVANALNLPFTAIFDANKINIHDECRRLREENTRLTSEIAKANHKLVEILEQLLEKK